MSSSVNLQIFFSLTLVISSINIVEEFVKHVRRTVIQGHGVAHGADPLPCLVVTLLISLEKIIKVYF